PGAQSRSFPPTPIATPPNGFRYRVRHPCGLLVSALAARASRDARLPVLILRPNRPAQPAGVKQARENCGRAAIWRGERGAGPSAEVSTKAGISACTERGRRGRPQHARTATTVFVRSLPPTLHFQYSTEAGNISRRFWLICAGDDDFCSFQKRQRSGKWRILPPPEAWPC